MAYVFRGGISFKGDGTGIDAGVERPTYPDKLYVPVEPERQLLVRVGSRVLKGQLIASAEHGRTAIHSPVSGIISAVVTLSGNTAVEIENDGQNEISPSVLRMNKKLSDCSPEEIIEKIAEAGISEMNGEGTPVAEKLLIASGKAEICIINCAECEPYILCDLAVLNDRPSHVINGLKIFLRALGIRRGLIAVPGENGDIIKKLGEMTSGSRMISVMPVTSKYPQGDDRRVVYAHTGHELRPHADPISAGCVIFNVQTCTAVYDAFVTGMPSVSRVVSVGGDCFKRTANLEVPIGTSFASLVKSAGGTAVIPKLILDGGPLRGRSCSLDGFVGKTTRALLLLSEKAVGRENSDPPVCIKCGKCVPLCPDRLMPNYIYNYLRDGKADAAVRSGALDCSLCGICSYICPGKAPVTELIADFKKRRNEKNSMAAESPSEVKHDKR